MPLLMIALLVPFIVGAAWPRLSTYVMVYVIGVTVLLVGQAPMPGAAIDGALFLVIALLGGAARRVFRPNAAS